MNIAHLRSFFIHKQGLFWGTYMGSRETSLLNTTYHVGYLKYCLLTHRGSGNWGIPHNELEIKKDAYLERHPLGGPTRVVYGKPLPKTLFILRVISISLWLFSDIQSHVCVMHEISHVFLIMFCIWTLMFHSILYVGSYGNACSRFQPMSFLDSRKSGTFLMVSCVFCRCLVVVYCWLFLYSFEQIFGLHIL